MPGLLGAKGIQLYIKNKQTGLISAIKQKYNDYKNKLANDINSLSLLLSKTPFVYNNLKPNKQEITEPNSPKDDSIEYEKKSHTHRSKKSSDKERIRNIRKRLDAKRMTNEEIFQHEFNINNKPKKAKLSTQE